MGVFCSKPFKLVSVVVLIAVSLFITPCCIAADDVVNGAIHSSSSPPPPPPPPPPPLSNGKPTSFSPFRPSIAIIVAVLTTMFSVTFLLLLYAKHCKRGSVVVIGHAPPSSAARKNSGIDRTTIESLPVFRFGSLRGQKDGLECAVCLTRFESSEVLRLLPKCKHAFHVECVDTWLDAHSTCPLCRYRVDPEDVLLIDEAKILPETHPVPPPENDFVIINVEGSNPGIRRVSGRHSSAGERGSGTGLSQFVLQRAAEAGPHDPASLRRSLDSAGLRKKSESIAVGCFDRPRKDGLLLTDDRTSLERTRFEHRIIVSPGAGGFHQRWSDVQPSDLLYLQSEMILSDSRRFSSSESGSRPRARQQHRNISGGNGWWGGRGVINARSVSEITGLSRFPNTNVPACSNQIHSHDDDDVDSRRAGVVSRWLAWISQSRPSPAVRLGRTTGIAA